jgi:hypothetical protein
MDGKFAATCLVFFLSLASPAECADLEIQQGEVLLSRGTGYHTIRNSTELLAGDTVVSKPGSTAKITFADGCEIYLGMGMIFTVEDRSPCSPDGANAGKAANKQISLSSDQASDLTDSWTSGTETSAITEDSQTNISQYLLGAAAVGGIAAGALALGGGGGGSSPISP